jgi:hypothetical protein
MGPGKPNTITERRFEQRYSISCTNSTAGYSSSSSSSVFRHSSIETLISIPLPALLFTKISPLSKETKPFTINIPNPTPSNIASSYIKETKRCCSTKSLDIPLPVSVTVRFTMRPEVRSLYNNLLSLLS